ncbi:hypothetical protein [Streptomyces sp. NPDC047841]|uniref:hypothetical protein n=1 Tax=Streptomyces sp. NPDC047841 TaxID=3154708 RepID=UPI0034542DDB
MGTQPHDRHRIGRAQAEQRATTRRGAEQADQLTREARMLWERAGMPARTHVVKATRHTAMRHELTLLLRASETGRPITGLSPEIVARRRTQPIGQERWIDRGRRHQGGTPGSELVHKTRDDARG